MTEDTSTRKHCADLQELLGYLNFSSGSPDAQFLRNLNLLYGSIESASQDVSDS